MNHALIFRPNPQFSGSQTVNQEHTNSTTGPQDGLVLLGEIDGPLNAEIARSVLEDAGITVRLLGNTIGRVYGLTLGAAGVVQLYVPISQAALAYDLLSDLDFGSSAE